MCFTTNSQLRVDYAIEFFITNPLNNNKQSIIDFSIIKIMDIQDHHNCPIKLPYCKLTSQSKSNQAKNPKSNS